MYIRNAIFESTKDCSPAASRLAQEIEAADAVLVGAGAGLSTAAGFTYGGERFRANFADFEAKYGFHDMYTGGFYPFPTQEEKWAYWSRFIGCNRYSDPPKPVYAQLLALLAGKDYFVLTTNVDHCFQKAGFDKRRLFYTQGDYGLWQCAKPCHDKTYDNEEAVRRMLEAQENLRVPAELVPRCPVCGAPMEMNLRADDRFVQDEGWYRAAGRYRDFVRRHKNASTLYLELGVGLNTPGIIKFNFWQQVAENPKAKYLCISKTDAYAPREITDRSLCWKADIAQILA